MLHAVTIILVIELFPFYVAVLVETPIKVGKVAWVSECWLGRLCRRLI